MNTILTTLIALPVFLPTVITVIAYKYAERLVREYIMRKKYCENFHDFITMLLTFEANGLRLDEVLVEAANNRINLPEPYNELALKFKTLLEVNPDPYSCIRRLADYVPCSRVKGFLRGYSEVLVTTNDTLSYIESILAEEFSAMRTRIDNTLSLVESLYEGLLIITLSIIVYSLTPITPINPLMIAIILSIIGIAGYLLAGVTTRYCFWPEYPADNILSLTLLVLTPFILVIDYVFGLLILLLTGTAMFYVNRLARINTEVEYKTNMLLEELYTDAKQGFPVDYSITRISKRYGEPFTTLRKLLLWGLKYSFFSRVFKLPPFTHRFFELVFSPLEYSGDHERHLGYVSRIMELVNSLRRGLRERMKLYLIYALTLPLMVIVLFHGMSNLASSYNTARILARGLGFSATYMSLIISSKIGLGCGLCSWKNLVILIIVYIVLFLYI